jgi:hypothetical protein
MKKKNSVNNKQADASGIPNALCTASTYSSDMALFKSLGLTPFSNIPNGKEHFVGEFKFDDGSVVKISVNPMPAQFWKFEVYIAERKRTMIISTGSGALCNFWCVVRLLATDMIDFKYAVE